MRKTVDGAYVDRVWIVEMWIDNVAPNRWAATVGCRLTRKDARNEMQGWRRRNTDTRFRVMMYERKERAK